MSFHAPIYGSQFHPPAKLYKRFTPTENFVLGDNELAYQNNYYRTHFEFRWTEADDLQGGIEQPISGLVNNNSYMTIKFHGRWKPLKGDITEPDAGDIISIDGELWIVEESGSQRVHKKSIRDFATIYLPLKKLL